MKNFKSKGSANAHVSGTIDATFDGSMDMSGTVTNLILEMESKNPNITTDTYNRYCKDIGALNTF